MKLYIKLKKNQKKKSKKNFFPEKKFEKIFFSIFFFKNNSKFQNIMRENTVKKFQNIQNWKLWKIEKINFFVPVVCTLKNFYETTLWCYFVFQKFFMSIEHILGKKKFDQKNFFPKKTLYRRNFEKKFFQKNRKI